MGALIDSSIFIASERGKLDLEAELARRLGEWFGMAAIAASELLAGTHYPGRTPRSGQPAISTWKASSVATRDEKSFPKIPWLRVERW